MMIWGKLGAFVLVLSFGVVLLGVSSFVVSSVSIRIRFTEGDVVVVVLGASASAVLLLSLVSLLSSTGSLSLCGRFIGSGEVLAFVVGLEDGGVFVSGGWDDIRRVYGIKRYRSVVVHILH